jgi:hypothetical protein
LRLSRQGPTTTIVTTTSESIFATGQIDLTMQCPTNGGLNCNFIYLSGVLTGVSAGSHTVAIGWKSTSPNHAAWMSQSLVSTAAILLGSLSARRSGVMLPLVRMANNVLAIWPKTFDPGPE